MGAGGFPERAHLLKTALAAFDQCEDDQCAEGGYKKRPETSQTIGEKGEHPPFSLGSGGDQCVVDFLIRLIWQSSGQEDDVSSSFAWIQVMKIFRILGLGSLLCSIALAQPVPSKSGPVADPELDYINTPEAVCAEMGILKQDEIIRTAFDLDGSGNYVTFLAFKGTGSRGGSNWTAYLSRDGKFQRIDNIQFREDFVREGKVEGINPSGGLLALYPGKGGSGVLVRYELKDGELRFSELPSLDYDRAEDRELFERIFGRKIDEPMPKVVCKNMLRRVIRVADVLERSRTGDRK